VTLLLELTGFVGSIALIRGKRCWQLTWAFLLAVGIAWSLACVASQMFFPYPAPGSISAHMRHAFVGLVTVVGIPGAILLGYLLKRLLAAYTTRQLTAG